MKTTRIFLIVLMVAGALVSYATWEPYGPDSLSANRICFILDNENHYGICHDHGFCLYDLVTQTWTDYPSDLPINDAHWHNGGDILVIMGCGSDSDGIYSFNPDDGQYDLVEYLECPNFIAYDEIIQKYYVGYHLGLVSSVNGANWDPMGLFDGRNIVDMEIYQNNIVLSQLDNIYSIWHSSDHGTSWVQSPLGSPMISDLEFDHDQKLYGIFPDESWSSGLWSSTDNGYTWEVEFWSVNLKCVGIDVFGDVYVGWDDNPSGQDEGIARWDSENGILDFINEGLSSLVINEIRINPTMSAIALFCCTDSGAYISLDYMGLSKPPGIAETLALDVYPNPTHEILSVKFSGVKDGEQPVLKVYDASGSIVWNETLPGPEKTIRFCTSRLSPGVYHVVLNCSSGIASRKIVVR